MDYLQKILVAFETHSPEEIAGCFQKGVDPNQLFEGKPLVFALINMYLRSPRFKLCVKTFVDHGLDFQDKALLAILQDDAESLEDLLKKDQALLTKTYSLNCAFTPLYNAGMLHICAEYNHIGCAEVLLKYGADVDAKAGIDRYGFGGQTPIFHTVNQHTNACMDMLRLLDSKGADLAITIPGLVWGKGYDWETFIPAVNPISYAMMGLLPQFQRKEKDIYQVVSLLLKSRYAIDYVPENLPNKYLQS